MTKMVITYIGLLLLAMQLSQVFSQNIWRRPTTRSPAMTVNTTKVGGARSNMTKVPDVVTSINITIPKGACAALQSSAFTLLIPMVAGSLLQGRA